MTIIAKRIEAPAQAAGPAELYLWLARVFAREPSPDALAAYRDGEGRRFLLDLAGAAALEDEMAAFLGRADGDDAPEELAFTLAGAYARLFLGAGGPSAVPPYESVYTSPEGRLFQRAATEMEALLGEHGLSVGGAPEPADHIAVELEFLARLTTEAAAGDAAAAARRRRLLDEHLLVWAPRFCALCIERDRSGHYAGAARLLDGLLRLEGQG